MILEQGEWIKIKQEDYNFHLDYNSYIDKREDDKKYTKKFEVLNDFRSDLSFIWLEQNEYSNETDDILVRRDRWLETLKKDIFLDEAVNVLDDLSQSNTKLSQLN